jgi:hypothetical protein
MIFSPFSILCILAPRKENPRMKNKAGIVVTLAFGLSCGLAQAQGTFGVGVIIGEPTGLSVKSWLNNTHAVDAGAAWSFSENESFQFHADYLIHDFNLLRPADLEGRVSLFYGLGGRIKLEDDDGSGRNKDDTLVGIRIPLGITYHFPRQPVELFGEFVPILDIAPDTDLDINLAIGARLYF